jgi:CubicO group peptidase (beta-lactamase class C family)
MVCLHSQCSSRVYQLGSVPGQSEEAAGQCHRIPVPAAKNPAARRPCFAPGLGPLRQMRPPHAGAISSTAWQCVFTSKAEGPSLRVTDGDNPLRTDLDKAAQVAAETFFSQPVHVGISFAVIENGDTHFYNYGLTSKLSRQRPTRRSIYEIASITKTLTGALASMAILDGKMSLDDDFRRYLTEPYPNLAACRTLGEYFLK